MKRLIGYGLISVVSLIASVWVSSRVQMNNEGIAHAAATAGGGLPVAASVATAAGGTSILLANPLRVTLFCENIGATNPVYITFGQTPTATNGFLLPANGGNISFPVGGCNSRTQSGGIGTGCVPTGAINGIATGGSSNTVCWED